MSFGAYIYALGVSVQGVHVHFFSPDTEMHIGLYFCNKENKQGHCYT